MVRCPNPGATNYISFPGRNRNSAALGCGSAEGLGNVVSKLDAGAFAANFDLMGHFNLEVTPASKRYHKY